MDFDAVSTIMINCDKGAAGVLEGEIATLGYEVENSRDNAVEIQGSLWDCMLLNLHLRTAINIMYEVGRFECNNPDILYTQVRDIPWQEIISQDEYFSVICRVSHPTIKNSMFASLKVKDAIVDRISAETGSRPDSGKERDNVVVHLYWHGKAARVYINTSGSKTCDRNYRKIPYKAPMRESLAAAVLLFSEYSDGQCLVNPMCGSGTIAVEAALMAVNRPPGIMRDNFCFMHLKGFNRADWETMRTEAKKGSIKGKNTADICPIIATDIEENAVKAAQANAKTAGVEHLITFDVCDFADTQVPAGPGAVIVNPEYGLRLGDKKSLESTYSRLGDFFKRKCTGKRAFIFTGNLDLAKKVGLRANQRTILYNSSIECRLLRYDIYEGSAK